MSRRRWILAGILTVTAAAVTAVLLHTVLREPADIVLWSDDPGVAVRVVEGDRSIDVELVGLPIVSGRVAYEGPRMSEDENWKPLHAYAGVSLRSILNRAGVSEGFESVTIVAGDGWNKTIPADAIEGTTACGTPILALSIDATPPSEWDDAPVLVFLSEDERFSNQDMLESFGPERSHYFGDEPATTGMMVKGVLFLVVDFAGGDLPSILDL